jgi:fibronectin type 3 domain-containing protein
MVSHYHRFLIYCLFLLVTTACSSTSSTPISETATLSWDASEPDLKGYKIYLATASGEYGAPIATVPIDITNYTVTGLETGTTYFFVVTAYDSNGTESSFSNEVSKTTL